MAIPRGPMRLIPAATDAINLQVISWDNDTRSQFKLHYSLLYFFVMLSLIIVQANNITLFERPRQPFSCCFYLKPTLSKNF
jgi:hypothetical protein